MSYFTHVGSVESSENEVWEEDDNISLEDTNLEAPLIPLFEDNIETQKATSLVLWIVGFFVSLEARYYIPDAAIDKLFCFVYLLFKVIGYTSLLLWL